LQITASPNVEKSSRIHDPLQLARQNLHSLDNWILSANFEPDKCTCGEKETTRTASSMLIEKSCGKRLPKSLKLKETLPKTFGGTEQIKNCSDTRLEGTTTPPNTQKMVPGTKEST
jgi:hypothetical protein